MEDNTSLGMLTFPTSVSIFRSASVSAATDETDAFGNSTLTFFAVPVISGAMTMAVLSFFLASAIALLISDVPTDVAATPLLAATAIGAMYMGVIWWGVFVYQLSLSSIIIPIAFYFFNLCLIVAAVVRDVVKAWQTIDEKKMPEQKLGGRRPWTNRLRHFLYGSHNWPWLGAVAILPLSGLLLILLLLFGQGPDAAVKMFTDTADWRLSQRIPPPNVYFDEHYLCTVAAGGHPFLVKPIRYGERHGHRVIVNRQLATANAFEDLLAERLPRFHRRIRAFYDAWGYPIARHIRRPWLADLVYLVMKPAEWLFILILYCFDVDPETRIAMQYLPQRKRIIFDETISESHFNL